MKRLTGAVLGGCFSLAAMVVPFTASAATISTNHGSQAFQIKLSGATEVPINAEPKDGILQGGFCTPDVHVFNENQVVPGLAPGSTDENHIVFAVNVAPQSKNAQAIKNFNLSDVKVNVLLYGANHQFLGKMNLPETVQGRVDPHTGKQFFVQCLWLQKPQNGGVYLGLPTGEYTYKFEATVTNPNGGHPVTHTRDWVPSNNTFTIVDGSATSAR